MTAPAKPISKIAEEFLEDLATELEVSTFGHRSPL